MSEPGFPYPDVHVLLKHAKRASKRLWNGERDDRAPQLIDELVRHLEEAERAADARERRCTCRTSSTNAASAWIDWRRTRSRKYYE